MIKTGVINVLMTIYLLLHYAGFSFAQTAGLKPNIILILADDLGWKDLSCYGSSFYETPNLDLLAASGIKFTQGYAISPVCSPTRASILTGKYPQKTGVTDWIKGRQSDSKVMKYEKLITPPTAFQLSPDEYTISEYALARGYTTFFAGKWHLGEEEKYWPQQHGFLINKGGWSKGSPTGRKNDTTGGFFTPYQNPTLPDGPAGEYLTDRLTNECLKFMEQKKDSPFFMVHSLYAVHNPLQAPPALVSKYKMKSEKIYINDTQRFNRGEAWMQYESGWKTRTMQDHPVYAAMIENMDWNIGRMVKKLEELNILDNTLILFTSDNGGLSTAEGSPTSNSPLRAGKGWLYEGGIRVPFIVYWKGRAVAGTVSDLPVHSADIFPTLAHIINGEFKTHADLDGKDIFSMMTKAQKYRKREIIWYYPHYSNQGGKPGAAIRRGNYKLLYHFEDKRTELFNIGEDISEQNNIAGEKPGKEHYLKKRLLRWLKQHQDTKFIQNPAYQK